MCLNLCSRRIYFYYGGRFHDIIKGQYINIKNLCNALALESNLEMRGTQIGPTEDLILMLVYCNPRRGPAFFMWRCLVGFGV